MASDSTSSSDGDGEIKIGKMIGLNGEPLGESSSSSADSSSSSREKAPEQEDNIAQRRGTVLRKQAGPKEETKAHTDDYDKPLGTPQFNLGAEENDDFELGRRPVGAGVK